MENVSVNLFVTLVKDYRELSKKVQKNPYCYEKEEWVKAGQKIDKILRERDRSMFEDEIDKQGLLF